MSGASEQIGELAAALCAAQGEFTAIPKTATNPFFKSKYAALPEVVAVAAPILAKNGLAVSQFLGIDGDGDTLTTWLMHTSGQFICESMRLHLTKQDAQGQGSATTYARRYAYMAVLGLVADEDDDGNAGSGDKVREPVPPRRPPTLTTDQRNRMVVAIEDAGYTLAEALVGAHITGTAQTVTTDDAKRIKIWLENQKTDVPVDDDELARLAVEVFGKDTVVE